MFVPIAGMTGMQGFDVAGQANLAGPEKSGIGGATSGADKQAFTALMEPAQSATGGSQVPVPHGSAALSGLEKYATLQKAEMQDNMQYIRDVVAAGPNLSMTEMAGFGFEMRLKMALTSAQFHVASKVGKDSGKGIDTLMKNQ